jgi:repressor LexA
MKQLTKRQEKILTFISNYIMEKGYSPSYQEIADAFGIVSKQGVARHVTALMRKGFIEKKDTTARSIRVIDERYLPSKDTATLPLLGRVSAGLPFLAEENVEDYIAVPRKFIKTAGRYFTLRVRGNSMINAGIFDGDMVIVLSTKHVEPGSVVVALIGDEVTVKRLIVQGNKKYLKAENPEYSDIYPQSEWTVQGKVVGLIRDVA